MSLVCRCGGATSAVYQRRGRIAEPTCTALAGRLVPSVMHDLP